MKSSKNENAKCCSMEKKRLVEELRKCDMSSTSYDEFHRCSRDVARESGKRSRACMLSRSSYIKFHREVHGHRLRTFLVFRGYLL